MTNKNNEHVISRENGWWGVLHETGKKPSRLFDNQDDALEYARTLAKKHDACIVVHNSKGKFRYVQCRDEIPTTLSWNDSSEVKKTSMMEPKMAPIMGENSNEKETDLRKIYQVVKLGELWAVVTNEDYNHPQLFKNKGLAMLYAYRLSLNDMSCVIIEKSNGKFENKICPPDIPHLVERIRMNTKM